MILLYNGHRMMMMQAGFTLLPLQAQVKQTKKKPAQKCTTM